MSSFIVQFPLLTEEFQEDILDKRFEIGRKIYNALVNTSLNRYKELIKTKRYRGLISQLTDDKDKNKPIYKQINDMRKDYGLTEYSLHADVKNMQKHFKDNIDSFTAQKIATNLWKAYEKLFFSNGEEVHYKKYGRLNSLEGKSNTTGIRFKDNYITWIGLKIPVKIDYNNPYESESLTHDISYCRIIRKFVKSKYKYYLQIVFKGVPPVKIDKNTGEVKHQMGIGDVGLDIGTQTIAISSKTDVKLFELADKIQNIENEKRLIQRKMDRSSRATNPNNYNSDGTIKKQGNKKVKWIKSNHYIKYQGQVRELYRKQTDIRKLQHELLANYIISLGDNIYVETMNFSALQKRSKKTEKNDKGKFKKKKRFGKSLANKAPSMLLSIIDRKLSYYNKRLIKIDTWSVKASQYNHFEKTYDKKKLSQRWNDFNGVKIQRDLYSAFLIMNVNNDLMSINQQKCNDRFDDFKVLHDLEIERLAGHKNLSSIAV